MHRPEGWGDQGAGLLLLLPPSMVEQNGRNTPACTCECFQKSNFLDFASTVVFCFILLVTYPAKLCEYLNQIKS
jgi:hypothetical protein